MADYTVISSVSRALLHILEKNMIPEVLQNQESIALCSPEEKGNMQLYVHLYHISECRTMAQNYQGYQLGADLQMRDSRFLYLYYLFTAVSSSEIRFRAIEEQNILGKVIQIMNDHHTLDIPDFSGKNQPPEPGIPVSMLNLSQEDMSRIWSSLQMKQRLALYYQIGPVELESEVVDEIRRVTDTEISIGERKNS